MLELHAQVQEILHSWCAEPNPYYLPGKWMPHCTLALELEPRLISQAVDIGLQLPLPLHGEITEIGVIEFRPVKHLFAFRLGDIIEDKTKVA